jgi:tetratricopeptide (TPR) repeat protein
MYLFRVLAIVTGAALTVAPMAAQISRPGGTSSGGSIGGGSIGGTGSPNGTVGGSTGGVPNASSGTNTPFPDSNAHPVFLSGKVVLSDGTLPSGQVLIESLCNNRRRAEAYTDSKGRFSFQLGQDREVFDDASESSAGSRPLGGRANSSMGGRQMDLQNCEIRASLPGFRSDTISLFNHQYLDNPELGTIILHRLENVEGLTISATTALAPKDARKDYEKGLEALKRNKAEEAQKDFEKSVEIYPKYAVAWFELGKIHEQANHPDEARAAYGHAIEADSKYINPYERLYMLAFKDSKWQEVADESDHVIRLNPYDFPSAYFYNAMANARLNKIDLAEKSAREAVKLDTKGENPRANYVLGVILANKGDFAGAADCLRAYLKAAPNDPDTERIRQQLAQIEQSAQAAQTKPPAQN